MNHFQVAAYFLLLFVLVHGYPVIKQREKRIVGGQPMPSAGRWPWIATLVFNQSHYCSGSIIDRKWIVTTSHCFHTKVTSKKASDWLVKVGKYNLSVDETHEQSFQVKQIIRHPNYTNFWEMFNIDMPDDYDIALLELQGQIAYTKYAKSITLLPSRGVNFLEGHECTIAGWGHTHYKGAVQEILHEVTVELVSRKKCNSPKSYNGSIHLRAICAGYDVGGRDACQYDSGGPLFCLNAGTWYLVGQVSWGEKCGLPYKYGVYSNMEVLTPWVRSTMNVQRNVFNRNG